VGRRFSGKAQGAAFGLGAAAVFGLSARIAKVLRGGVSPVLLAGGVLSPVLMLLGLQRASALSGALLLNLEAPFTVLLAVALFREHLEQ
jgi:drug/metabolite transporter (DMT)-like permease